MIDNADLAIIETHLDEMNPVERGLVEELRRARDELEEAQEQLEKSISPSALEEAEHAKEEAEEALEKAENQRDEARDLAEERSKEIDELRAKLVRAETRGDEAVARAGTLVRTLEGILGSINDKLGAVSS